MAVDKVTKKELKNTIRSVAHNDVILKINTLISSLVEIQRIFAGTFFIIPKICNKTICSYKTTQFNIYDYPSLVIYSNLFMLFLFILMYSYEIRREYLLINSLCNDKTIACDNENVYGILNLLPAKTQQKIIKNNNIYKVISYITIIYFIVNTFANSYILYLFYSYPALLLFITNTLFMGTKLNFVFGVIHTDKYILYSAYINEKYQFNYIIPKILKNIQANLDNNNYSNQIEIQIANL